MTEQRRMMLRATAIGILAIAAVAVGLLAPWALPVVVIILVGAVSAAARHVSSLFSRAAVSGWGYLGGYTAA